MNAIDTYRQTAVGTQSSGRLVVMLYDGAIKFLKLAIKDKAELDQLLSASDYEKFVEGLGA